MYRNLREQGYSKDEAAEKALVNLGADFATEMLFDKGEKWLFNHLPFRNNGVTSGIIDGADDYNLNNVDDIFLQNKLCYNINGEKLFIPERSKFENVVTIAGNGGKKPINDINRLVSTYGGNENSWKKQAGKINSEKYIFDIHWYEKDSIQYEAKLKNRTERK